MIEAIIQRLTVKGEEFAHLHWVGKDYSKADLLRDLRLAQAEDRQEMPRKAWRMGEHAPEAPHPFKTTW